MHRLYSFISSPPPDRHPGTIRYSFLTDFVYTLSTQQSHGCHSFFSYVSFHEVPNKDKYTKRDDWRDQTSRYGTDSSHNVSPGSSRTRKSYGMRNYSLKQNE